MGHPVNALKFPKQRRNYWRETPNAGRTALANFTPQFYVTCMGSGCLAVLEHQVPWQFRGLRVITDIIWILDILLFFSITVTFAARWACYPRLTSRLFITDVEMTTYLATTTVATSTLVELVAFVLGSTWAHWDTVCFALFWCVTALAVFTGTLTYWILIRDEEVSLENLGPTLLYPVMGVLSTASMGSVVCSYTTISDEMALPVCIVSYILLGWGFFFGLMTTTSYFTRLLAHQTPPPKKIGAQFIPVGVFSNAAYAFNSLGYVAGPKRHLLELTGAGAPVSGEIVGTAVYAFGFVMGLVIWGFATFWVVFAAINFCRDIHRTSFNINHWSATYPIGIYGVATAQLGTALDSRPFKGIAAAILVIAVVLWLYLVMCTVVSGISGELFLGDLKLLEETKETLRAEEGGAGEEMGRTSSSTRHD